MITQGHQLNNLLQSRARTFQIGLWTVGVARFLHNHDGTENKLFCLKLGYILL